MKSEPSKVRKWLSMVTLAVVCLGLGWGSQVVFGRKGKIWHTRPSGKTLAPVRVVDLSPLVAKLKPAVFNLRVRGSRPSGRRNRYWFYRGRRRQFRSKGSGFLINAQGYALTNHHVVRYANNIQAELADKRTFKVKVIGKSPELDVALIKLIAPRGTRFPYAYLGNSSKVQVGEPAIAIGNARGLGFSVTAGIISAKGRALNGQYENYIQTDAAINHGNSGGPLFNQKGEVIGINTAILRGGRGIGFAVPINIVKRIIPQLKRLGKVQRAQLGVSIQRITPELARSFGLKGSIGALVAEVIPNTPASKAGIRVGDVIVSFNGRLVRNYSDLPRLVAFNPPGSVGKIVLIRNKRRITLNVKLMRYGSRVASDIPRTNPQRRQRPRPKSTSRALRRLGVGIKSVSARLRRELGIGSKGVEVSFVKPGSVAEKNGLRRGDVIVEVKRQTVKSTRHFLGLINNIRSGENVLLLVRRSNSALFLAFPLP